MVDIHMETLGEAEKVGRSQTLRGLYVLLEI
jgi:hypothetical protein